MMKIITGIAKGKRLLTLEGDATRPTSERIKEAIFSSLQFDLEDRAVLDLFAGSGQMGLEALSRGSKSAMFVDASLDAMNVVKTNAKACGFFDRSRFLVSDARNYIRKASGRECFDLVFIDPPYGMMCAADAVGRLAKGGMLRDGAIVVTECGEEEVSAQALSPFGNFEEKKITRYGKKTFVGIFIYRGAPQESEAQT